MLTPEQRSDLAYLTGRPPSAFGAVCRTPPDPHIQNTDRWGGSIFTWWIAGCVHHLAAYQMLDSQLFTAITGIAVSLQNYWSGFAGELMDTAVLR